VIIVADDILDATATTAELGKTAGKDKSVNKATYVQLLGLEKSKSEAKRYISEGKAAIAMFGDRAIPLLQIADYIGARKN
jgi:geranylgeranyl diphosphate synthase, type II